MPEPFEGVLLQDIVSGRFFFPFICISLVWPSSKLHRNDTLILSRVLTLYKPRSISVPFFPTLYEHKKPSLFPSFISTTAKWSSLNSSYFSVFDLFSVLPCPYITIPLLSLEIIERAG